MIFFYSIEENINLVGTAEAQVVSLPSTQGMLGKNPTTQCSALYKEVMHRELWVEFMN